MSAAAAVLLAAESITPFEAARHVRHRNRFTSRPRTELTRKGSRAADRSKKQYLLKGIRP
jgi:hypothetical protein